MYFKNNRQNIETVTYNKITAACSFCSRKKQNETKQNKTTTTKQNKNKQKKNGITIKIMTYSLTYRKSQKLRSVYNSLYISL